MHDCHKNDHTGVEDVPVVFSPNSKYNMDVDNEDELHLDQVFANSEVDSESNAAAVDDDEGPGDGSRPEDGSSDQAQLDVGTLESRESSTPRNPGEGFQGQWSGLVGVPDSALGVGLCNDATEGGNSKKKRPCRKNRKRYRLYAITVSIACVQCTCNLHMQLPGTNLIIYAVYTSMPGRLQFGITW